MRLRLNIALVLCSRSSILLLDAVMAVWRYRVPAEVRRACRELASQGRTIVAAFDDDEIVQLLAHPRPDHGRRAGRERYLAGEIQDARHGRDLGGRVVGGDLGSPEDDAVVMRELAVDAAKDGGSSSIDLTMAFEARLDSVRCRLRWS